MWASPLCLRFSWVHFGLGLAATSQACHWLGKVDLSTAGHLHLTEKLPPNPLLAIWASFSLASPSSPLLVCPLLSTWARNPTGGLLFLPGGAMASSFSRGSVRGGAAVRDALSSRELGLRPQGSARPPSQPSWMKEALRWGTQQGPPPCVNACTTISVYLLVSHNCQFLSS